MTKEPKKRAINRLQTMYPLRALVDEMYRTSMEARKGGKPVAWSMVTGGLGEPFLDAMDVEIVFPENYGAVCAASGGAATFLDRSDAEGFPSFLCGYARNCFGYSARMKELGQVPPEAPMGGMPKPVLLLSTGRRCDAHYKWFQALGRYMDVAQWTLEEPHPGEKESLMEGAYEADVSFLATELKEFVVFLERLLGKKMDWDKLEEIIDSRIKIDTIFYRINELRKARPCPMHSRDFWSCMNASLFGARDPEKAIKLYGNMYDEVKQRVDNKIAGVTEEKYRVTFEGGPPWHSLGFFDELAERGWNFVTERHFHPPYPLDLTWVTDPVERYVRHRYQGVGCLIDYTFEASEASAIKKEIMERGFSRQLFSRQIRDYRCDGAFVYTIISCHSDSTSVRLVERQLMEAWKIPSLVVEGDIVDKRVFDPVDTLRKAEAFEEIMDRYKKIRKEEGFTD